MQIRKVTNKPRKDGTQKTSYVLDYVDNWGRRRRPQFDTRTAAIAERDRIIQAEPAGDRLPAYLFQDAADDYLKVCEKVGRDGRDPIEPETVQGYRINIELHLKPRLGKQDISQITAPDVVAVRDWLVADSGKSHEIIRMAFLHYKGILQEGFNRGKIKNHVWGGVRLTQPKKKKRDRFDEDFEDSDFRIPTKQEAARLIEVAAQLRADPRPLMGWGDLESEHGPRGWKDVMRAWQRYYPLILMAIFTGMRQGELRALHWSSVKLDRGLVYVRHAASGTGRLKEPKSEAGFRVLDLPDILVAALRSWKKECPPGGLVFPTGAGTIESKSNLRKRCWQRLVEFAEIDRGLTFHTLRHYYASTIIAAGFGPKEVQVDMGHADIQTTFNIYGHLFPEDRAERRSLKQASADQLMAEASQPKVINMAVKRRS